jgi:hypothetical protein
MLLKGSSISDKTANKNQEAIMLSSQQQYHRADHHQQQQQQSSSTSQKAYQFWREYAVELAALPPDKIIETLKTQDPFGVRAFESRLLESESQKEAFLTLSELQTLFPCPSSIGEGRITLPDQRNHDKAKAFRNGTAPYFLFFQHLRKAGGTNFCALAEHNLLRKQVPSYYCSTCTTG